MPNVAGSHRERRDLVACALRARLARIRPSARPDSTASCASAPLNSLAYFTALRTRNQLCLDLFLPLPSTCVWLEISRLSARFLLSKQPNEAKPSSPC